MSITDGGNVLLRSRGLRVERAGRDVLHGIDLDLCAGEITALLGPNGAGKSTLLEALAGLLAPAAGTIERSGRVALALQSPDLARRSVTANVKLGLAWWGVPRAQRHARATEALAAMNAGHLAERAARTLSGGERRRVHLARALSVRPDVLMLDEPFAGLDAATRASLLDDTGSALRANAQATLIVVHERAEAWALADRLLVLLDGRLVADGPPRELLERPPSIEVARFLGFDGTLSENDGTILLTRAQHVTLDPLGPIGARVRRTIPLEDGVRLELELEHGRVYALAPIPGPAAGERVQLSVKGGLRFALAAAPTESHDPVAVVADSAHEPKP
ncbi:MAG: ABC transporter ATP-binding protein [Solirubrobacterales bacterium]|nr:ABC transporter ATP-binding protein [Solirubrobacterales bacterium]